MSDLDSDTSGAGIDRLKTRIRALGRLPFITHKSGDLPASPSESYLCESCELLDLRVQSFLVQPDDNEHERENKFRYLGRLSQIRDRTTCPCCRLILHIADRPLDQRNPSHVATDDPVVYARWVVDGQEEVEDPARPGLYKYRPCTRRILIYSSPQTFKDGYLVLLADDAPSRAYFGRRLEAQDTLDAQMLRQWMHDCETLHADCRESLVHAELMGPRTTVFRAIDVDQQCIVEPPSDCRYVALSYLWGKGFQQLFTTSANLPKLSKAGALAKEKLPRTIKDAIRLTQVLGERYLWTDSLALLHDEGFQYHDDWVYSRASLTIIAGSGKDANAGLPGVRKASRTVRQEVEEVKPGIRLCVSHLAEDYISTSFWDHRAWTFGERMLSTRCLLFVNGRIYFQCRSATFCEDIETPSRNGWSLNSIDMPTRIFKEKPFWQFTAAVELYTQRELTNQNDVLEAFEGVGFVLEKRLSSKLFFGMLEDMMDTSLIWESTKLLEHRLNFSTMSWAGWIGEIQWKVVDEMAESWIQWHTYHVSDELIPFPAQKRRRIAAPVPKKIPDTAAGYSLSLGSSLPLLYFQTVSASFTLSQPKTISKDIMSPLRKRMTGPSALATARPAPTDPGLIRVGITDKDGQWCGTIDLSTAYRSLIGIAFEFLIMSRLSRFVDQELDVWEGWLPDAVEDDMKGRDYGVYNVLLVSQRDGVCYREGLGRILASSLGRALEPGPTWRNIILG